MVWINVHYVALRHILCGEHYQHIVSSRLSLFFVFRFSSCLACAKTFEKRRKKEEKEENEKKTELLFHWMNIQLFTYSCTMEITLASRWFVTYYYIYFQNIKFSMAVIDRMKYSVIAIQLTARCSPKLMCVLCTIYATCDLRSHWTVWIQFIHFPVFLMHSQI